MNIRYLIKNKHTGTLHFKWYSIKAIERGLEKLFDVENYDIITRDRFTGLYDNTGLLIYEGDVIRSFDSKEEEVKHTVSYDKEGACFVAVFMPTNIFNPHCGISQNWVTEFDKEVVSNIHDVK